MGWMGKLQELQDMLNISKRPDYHVNKWLFRGALILIFGMAAWCVHLDGWGILTNKVWVNTTCDPLCLPSVAGEPMPITQQNCHLQDESCLYMSEDARDKIPLGQLLAKKPSWLTQNFTWLAILIFFMAFVLNKLIHNRGRKLIDIDKMRRTMEEADDGKI